MPHLRFLKWKLANIPQVACRLTLALPNFAAQSNIFGLPSSVTIVRARMLVDWIAKELHPGHAATFCSTTDRAVLIRSAIGASHFLHDLIGAIRGAVVR